MAIVVPHATRSTVEAALRGRRADVRGRFFESTLVLALLASLAILVTLRVTTMVTAWPVLSTRGWDFVRSDTSSIESRAGDWQGLTGSFILVAFVATLFHLSKKEMESAPRQLATSVS